MPIFRHYYAKMWVGYVALKFQNGMMRKLFHSFIEVFRRRSLIDLESGNSFILERRESVLNVNVVHFSQAKLQFEGPTEWVLRHYSDAVAGASYKIRIRHGTIEYLLIATFKSIQLKQCRSVVTFKIKEREEQKFLRAG